MFAILLALAFIALLLFIVLIGQPTEFVVSRSIAIAAPPARIYPHVNGLRQWEAWNPWLKMDPNCQMTYDGPAAGIGATYAWTGKKVGAGRSTITESQPDQRVRLRLEFFKPMTATNTAEFTFRPDGNQTVVTWSMMGTHSLPAKVFGMFMNFDKMCGDQFEKGLAQMKSVVESAG